MEKLNQPVVIHIGYPKAASSFLKRDYLASLTDNFVIPRGALLDTIRYSSSSEKLKDAILQCVKNDSQPIVISNENLSGSSFWSLDTALGICENLHKAFPCAKVLILIREQRAYLLSAFKYSVYTGHHLPPFAEFFRKNVDVIREKLQYHTIINAYVDRFGIDNVFIFPVELLKSDRNGVYGILSGFTGLQRLKPGLPIVENISPKSWNFIEFVRKANIILKYVASAERVYRRSYMNNSIEWDGHRITVYRFIVDNLATFFDESSYQGKILDERSAEIFARSNKLTEDVTGQSLKEHGYL